MIAEIIGAIGLICAALISGVFGYLAKKFKKENEIQQLNNQQAELKKEILRNKDDYEKIIDDATNQIETFLEKANQKDSIQ